MKTMKSLVVLVVILLALLTISSEFLIGCSSSPAPATTTGPASTTAASTKSSPAPTQASSGGKMIRWGASNVGSSGYTLSAGMANLIQKYAGYQTNISPAAGVGATIRAIGRGELEFGFGGADTVYNAYNGVSDFAKDGKQNVMAVAMTYTTAMAFVGQPGINTIPDLKGKVFMYRRPTNLLWGQYGDAVLKAYGLGEDTVKVKESIDTNTLLDSLKTGVVDAAMVPGSIPNSFITQLMEAKNFSLVDVDKDKILAISKQNPSLIPMVIPAGTYKGQTKDINTMGFAMMIFCRGDLPEQMVYDVTKAVYGHLDEFSMVDPLAKQFTLQVATKNLAVPLHPGAQKYFQEMGVLSK